MRPFRRILTILAVGISSCIQTPQAQNVSTAKNALSELNTNLGEIAAAEHVSHEVMARFWRAYCPEPKGTLGFCSYPTDWYPLKDSDSGRLYVEARQALSAWLDAVRTGQDPYPPMAEIMEEMDQWRQHHKIFMSQMEATIALVTRINPLERLLDTLPASSAQRTQVIARWKPLDRELTKTLGAAGRAYTAPFNIPKPILPSDRTSSPFSGPTTPGTPDRLWIWLQRASVPSGGTIHGEIGLGNSKGANVIADKQYSVTFNCNGCIIDVGRVTLRPGDHALPINLTVTASEATLTAQNAQLKPSAANPHACGTLPQSSQLISMIHTSETEHAADGTSSKPEVWFVYYHADGTFERATNYQRKTYAPSVTSPAHFVIDQKVGSIQDDIGDYTLPADECVGQFAVASDVVGISTISIVASKDSPNQSRTLRFCYSYPTLDWIMVWLGALIGFVVSLENKKSKAKVPWYWKVLSSGIGAFLVFLVGVYYVLDVRPLHHTWAYALGLALIGGVLGLSVVKLIVRFATKHAGI